jgi:hypothetical protein
MDYRLPLALAMATLLLMLPPPWPPASAAETHVVADGVHITLAAAPNH